eukprot:784279-Pleurochrysis_carterae.AAC.1
MVSALRALRVHTLRSERRSNDHLLSSSMLVRPDSTSSSAIAEGGGVILSKNCWVGDMPAYKAEQLLGTHVVGAFALDVRVLGWSSGLAANFSRSGARMRMSWWCSRISAGQ